MQVYRTVHHILLVAMLLFACGSLSAAQSHQVTKHFSQAELDQMLAPIALYPDSVLTHVLIAATYPLEVVQAARWLEQNPGLSGEAALDAVSGRDWDPSVQALVAFPHIIKRLNEDLLWTQQLGEAFISDEVALLASIQRLRQRAYAQGSLKKMEHVVVEREREVIIIEPARREVVYVPYYDTRVVYGNWWWPAYPPVYWYEPVGYRSHVTFYWGSGFTIRPSFYFSVFDWHRRHVVVHHHYYHTPPRYYPKRQHFHHAPRWQHDQYHRRGVHYHHTALRDRQDFYHSRPEQRRTTASRTTEHQREWRAERRETTYQQQNPRQNRNRDQQQQRASQHPATVTQASGVPASRRMQEAERAERRLREAQFADRQRNVQQRQQGNERRQQSTERQAPTGDRIAQQWAENEQRMQPILPAESESVRPNRRQEQISNRATQEQRTQRAQPQPQEQRLPTINRQVQEQRAQTNNRPVQEQRVQTNSRPVQEQRVQTNSRPVQEQRSQTTNRSVPEQRVQAAARTSSESRNSRPEVTRAVRTEPRSELRHH